jgi:hypothetical protein
MMMDLKYLDEGLQDFSAQLLGYYKRRLDDFATDRALILSFFIIFLVLGYFLVVSRAAHAAERQIKRTRAMLLLIPRIVIKVSLSLTDSIREVIQEDI